ncbi:hypothetical protein AAVH_19310 [Aphelenchoides avenae]|nr:hypothetical protein AAVH_19310 [Aphelenchus avenae]
MKFVVYNILYASSMLVAMSAAIKYSECEHTITAPAPNNGTGTCDEDCRLQCALMGAEHILSNCTEIMIDHYAYNQCCCNTEQTSLWQRLWQ